MPSPAHQQWLEQIGSVLETLNQGVIINDDKKCVVFANSVFLEMIKLPAERLLGRAVTDLYPPEDVAQLVAYIGRRETEGRARYEFYIPQSDGGRLPVAVTARQVRGPDGHLFSVVTATDITEQKRTELELRHANVLLQERQRQVEEELQLAERVQQSLVPRSLRWGGVSVEAHYQPAWSIGGDYGLVAPTEGRLDILVCDVSGHGISSALVANRIYSETMAQVERGTDLESMLRHLNRFVLHNLGGSNFYFTLAAIRLDQNRNTLQFAGAGHPPAIIVRKGQTPGLIESNSMVLGLFDNVIDSQAVTEVPIQAGDRVLIYTDGLTENFNSHGEMLGIEGVRKITAQTSHLPLPEMKQQILDHAATWRNGPATDDVSLVLVEIA